MRFREVKNKWCVGIELYEEYTNARILHIIKDLLGYTPMLTTADDPNTVVMKTIHHLSWKRYHYLKDRNQHMTKLSRMYHLSKEPLSSKFTVTNTIRPLNLVRYIL